MSDLHPMQTPIAKPFSFGQLFGSIAFFPAKILRMVRSANVQYRWRAERYRSRIQLLQMEDYMLHDIGITREDAVQEAAKDFWD